MHVTYSIEIVWWCPALCLFFHLTMTMKIIELKFLQKNFTESEIKAKSPKGN